MKRMLCLTLCLILMLLLCSTDIAPDHYILNTREAAYYDRYVLNIDALAAYSASLSSDALSNYSEASYHDLVLSISEYVESTEVVGSIYASYTSDILADYLYDCKEVTSIERVDDRLLYIWYDTNDGKTVWFTYKSDNTLLERGVYDESADIVVSTVNGVSTLYNLSSGWGNPS